MLLHEYQSKKILRSHGVSVPTGEVALSSEEALRVHRSLGTAKAVVKAQILAGGRGKAGGVKVCQSPKETQSVAKELLGKTLKTVQSGPQGEMVHAVLVEAACEIAHEFYLAITVNRARACPVLLFSAQGGMDIESVPQEKIFTQHVDPVCGFSPFLVRKVSAQLGLSNEQVVALAGLTSKLFDIFRSQDLSLLEINPLIWTKQGAFLPLDAKFIVDDNALFRHADLAALKDISREDPKELQAAANGLSYIRLDGNIGCMVNGAGLAMATMDIIGLHGGRPANFLDVGGGADTRQVTEAFKILLSDSNVKAVLVNIFGGIMKCDVIAEGILGALKQVSIKVPLVVRLEGTRVDIGRKILKDSGLPIIEATTMDDAARKVVGEAQVS